MSNSLKEKKLVSSLIGLTSFSLYFRQSMT